MVSDANVLSEGVDVGGGGMVLGAAGVLLWMIAVMVCGGVEGIKVVVGSGAVMLGGGSLLGG